MFYLTSVDKVESRAGVQTNPPTFKDWYSGGWQVEPMTGQGAGVTAALSVRQEFRF